MGPGLGFTLDRRLPGTSAEASPVPLSAMAALAGLLAGLGGIPTNAAARIGNPYQPALDLHALHRRALAAARRLLDAGELTAAQLRRVQDAQPLLSAPPQQVVLVHGDLKGEHLLIDQGRVSGVLDWTDAELGDPATDVAGLAIAVGARRAALVAAAAGHDHHTRRRGTQLARCDAILRLEQRPSGQDTGPLPLLRGQLQRALQPTAPHAATPPR